MSRKSAALQLRDQDIWRNQLYNILLGRFEWDGLPEGLTSRQLELFITSGLAVGFEHKIVGATILPGQWAGTLNIYGLPNRYTAFGYNQSMPAFDLDADKCVPFYDNPTHRGVHPMIDETASQLSLIWGTIKLNTRQQKHPWVFGGDEDQIQSLKQAMNAVDQNQFAYFTTKANKALIEEGQLFFPTLTPYIANDLFTQFRQTLNTLLTNLGIDNMPIEKKERQLADEVHGNKSLVMYYREAATRERRKAAEDFNSKFGTSLSVKWRGCSDCGQPGEEVEKDGTSA